MTMMQNIELADQIQANNKTIPNQSEETVMI